MCEVSVHFKDSLSWCDHNGQLASTVKVTIEVKLLIDCSNDTDLDNVNSIVFYNLLALDTLYIYRDLQFHHLKFQTSVF